MATKSQEILLKGNTTNASAVPSSLKIREIAINALDRSLFTNDGNNIVKLYTGTTKWFDVNGNANNALKLGGVLASEYIDKKAFNTHTNNTTIHITASERTAWNNKWDYNEETIKGIKVNAAVSADKATKLATARTLWGKPFDGSANVAGDIHLGNDSDFEIGTGYSHSDTNRYNKIVFGAAGTGLQYISGGWTGGNIIAHNFKVRFSETTALAITNNANVLIGTTTDNGYKLDVNGTGHYSGDLVCGGEVAAIVGEGTPAGVTDYSALTGKPQINGVTLISGNNTLASLGIQAAGDYATNSGVTTLLADYAKKTFVSNNYVGKSAFNSHTADTDIHITATERTTWNAKWTYNEATIKAVKVTSASSADSVAWSGIKNKPSTFTPSAHTHTASEVSGLPISLKNPCALTFGSKTYDGSAAATITASDLGALTSITKSMVEGVLTGNITSHTHTFASLTSKPTTIAGYGITDAYTATTIDSKLSGYLPLSGGTIKAYNASPLTIKVSTASNLLTFITTDNTNNYIERTVIGYYASSTRGSEFRNATSGSYIGITDKGTPHYNGNTLLHSGNYNSYAPTLTGTGASGTWGISITGNAATATKLATPRTIWGQHFDGTANVSGVLSDVINVIFDANKTYGIIRGDYFSGALSKSDIVLYSQKLCLYGNILIGTTIDNGYKLDVNGDAHITGDLVVDGEVSALVA